MVMKSVISAMTLAAAGAAARSMTVYNACPFTIWPGMYTDPKINTEFPNFPTGWQADAFTAVTFTIPNGWTAGRIWGRRNCDMSRPGPNNCLTGGCLGGVECDRAAGTGVPPATVAEWTLSTPGGVDYYDVSVVDGYNLPMKITNNKGCPVPDCPVDLGPNCPGPLKGPFDQNGFPVGCKSACSANLSGDPTNSPNCCSGHFDTPQTCPRSNVQFNDYFKSNCPNAYSYAYDEASNSALWTCETGKAADYTLTFCP